MKENSVGWFEIYVSDVQRARSFYESVFSVKLEKLPAADPDLEMWVFPYEMAASGSGGAICKMRGLEPGHNSVIVYFSCEDCATQEKKAAASGGKVFKSKTSIGQWGFISLVTDSEGNMIGLHSRK